MYIVWMHLSLEETVSHINGGPYLSFSTVCQNIIDMQQWKVVRHSVCIQLSIITNPSWKCCLICFRYYERRQGMGGG